MSDLILSTKGLLKTYGGINAVDHVDYNVKKNEVNALIGPNGAGKTTLVGQITGEILPDQGSILFNNYNITRQKAYKRSHLGMSRSFQVSSVFLDLTVLENIYLAIQAHSGNSFQLLKAAREDVSLISKAIGIAKRFGLRDKEHVPASNISHGERRQLEIAMALAPQPQLLVLDEPMAGMGLEESNKITHLLKSIKGSITIILVEHNMDTVFALADTLTVLVSGKIIASGKPSEVRLLPEVRKAYLGD